MKYLLLLLSLSAYAQDVRELVHTGIKDFAHREPGWHEHFLKVVAVYKNPDTKQELLDYLRVYPKAERAHFLFEMDEVYRK